ncbi:MAG: hypothetical protein CFH43_00159 [Proteobacteria bacterium]|nr:MAG: hypothetical protein CFH43_00159 [Pseudomonadota bacterium]
MLELSAHILDVMVIIMLAVVGALVLWLHFRLYQLRSSEKNMYILSEELSESLRKANRGLFEFSRVVREEGPKLDKEVFKAGQTVQDLDFMLAKAEKLLKRMDAAFDQSEGYLRNVEGEIKSNEKELLLGKKQQSPVIDKPLQKTVQKSSEDKSAVQQGLSDVEIEKKLERDLLMGLISDVPKRQERVQAEEKPKKMINPRMGAMAYGEQVVSSSGNTDAERDLIKALEGRL